MQDYIREGQLFNELWDAIEEDEDPEKVSELIKSGCDVNGRDGAAFDDGITFLMVAAASGNLEIVKLLVESGADVNAWSRDSDFALSSALLNGHQKVADYLRPLTSPKLRAMVDRVY